MSKIENIEATPSSEANVSSTLNEQSTIQLSLKSHRYSWNINEFSHCLRFHKCQFSSPKFIFQDTEWRLRLCVVNDNGKVEKMKILLVNLNKIDGDLYFKNTISVVVDDGRILSQDFVEFSSSEDNAAPSYLVQLLYGSELHDLPDKFTIRSEFSSLISEQCEDAESSLGKSVNQNVSDSPCDTKDGASNFTLYKRRTRRSSSRRVPTKLETFFMFILMALLVIPMAFYLDHVVKRVVEDFEVADSVPTHESSEIDYLIYDSTKKLNLIAEALNLTSVKEKSSEILAIYSKMFNSTDRVLQHAKQGIESNMTDSLTSKISSFVASEIKQFILGMKNDTEISL